MQLLAENSKVTTTTWVTRREPMWREGPFTEEAGRAAVALVEQSVREGLPPQSVVSVTGLGLTPEVADAKARGVFNRLPMFDHIAQDAVVWNDGREIKADVILWCTGFRASLAHLAPLNIREPGGGIRMLGTQVAREPRLHLVGYGPSSSTIGATRAGRAAASGVITLLDLTRAAAGATTARRPPDRALVEGDVTPMSPRNRARDRQSETRPAVVTASACVEPHPARLRRARDQLASTPGPRRRR